MILCAGFFYVRYAVSCRDLEEMMAERGVIVDHATLNRRVVKYSPLLAAKAQNRKTATGRSWRVDETCIKVKGRWSHPCRAIDRDGNPLVFRLSQHRDEAAATAFFARTVCNNGWPDKVVIDRSSANLAGIETARMIRKGQSGIDGKTAFHNFAALAGRFCPERATYSDS